jgi:LemA protein
VLTTILVAILALLLYLALTGYNQLIRSRNQTREAWSGIDVQLRRRASLIPNLIEAVRAYAQHERETFEQVTRARSALQSAGGAGEAANANNELTQALGRLFALVESYPQLRASENFRSLQGELSDIEEKIAFARQFYNRNVLDYNNRIDVVPTTIIARTFDFRPMEFFDAGDEGRAEVRGGFISPLVPSERPTTPPAA